MLIADSDARYLQNRITERRRRSVRIRGRFASLFPFFGSRPQKVIPFMSRTDATEIARPRVTTPRQVSYTEAADEMYRVRIAQQHAQLRADLAATLGILPENVRAEFVPHERHRLYGQIPADCIHTDSED